MTSGGPGVCEEETLGSVTAKGHQLIELRLRLDASRDDAHPEGMGEVDDRADDGLFGDPETELLDERLIDLHEVERKQPQVGQ